jgi:2-haloacid dehalogenase
MIYFLLKKLEHTNQSSKVYDLPINKYKIKKNEVTFLSSNTWDVSGGGNYGYKSIWVNRNNNIFDNLDFKPKYEIKSLIELKNIINKD